MWPVVVFVGSVVLLLVVATWPDGGLRLGWGPDHDRDRDTDAPGRAPRLPPGPEDDA